jgi:hypothetical protein
MVFKMHNPSLKKGLMYLTGEDFYFFAYAILLILDCLQCHSGRVFKDHRKLAFLIEFVTSSDLRRIVGRHRQRAVENRFDREYLFDSYARGIIKRGEVLKLLLTMERRGLVSLTRGSSTDAVDVMLRCEQIPESFFDKELFKEEYANCFSLKADIPRLSVLTLDGMLTRIYDVRGIKRWAL